ncbi:MAG: GNAT family N-acetyltransferase [Anaerolineae bacterium]|nr:GNAT family N-acetyltransferase [Anaerolineae bacterium]
MSVWFKRAAIHDTEALVSAAIAAFHHDSILYPEVEIGGPPGYDSPAVMRRKIVEGECYTIVEGERVIGGLVVFVEGDGHYHLDLIFIVPDRHNRGIGTQAMRFLENTCSAARWTLDTPTWATRNIHFYEKLGYVRVGEFEDGDITLIAYEKHMSDSER